MKCQHQTERVGTEETSGGRWIDYDYKEPCDKPVFAWRQCGAGAAVKCKKEIGYCEEHGGDERSQREMVEHHKEHASP